MRDYYQKYRKALQCRSGDGAKIVKPYRYAKAMGFLTPYLGDRPTTSNFADDEFDDLEPENDLQPENDQQPDDSFDDPQPETDLTPSTPNVAPSTPNVAASSHSKRKKGPRKMI